MKAHIKLPSATVEIEGETQADLHAEWSRAAEVFGETNCGLCGSDRIRPVVRVVQGKDKKAQQFTYHEWQCQKCRARLALGQQEGGRLFPKRKLNADGQPDMENGTYGDHNGWFKYRPQADAAPAEAAVAADPPRKGRSY